MKSKLIPKHNIGGSADVLSEDVYTDENGFGYSKSKNCNYVVPLRETGIHYGANVTGGYNRSRDENNYPIRNGLTLHKKGLITQLIQISPIILIFLAILNKKILKDKQILKQLLLQ